MRTIPPRKARRFPLTPTFCSFDASRSILQYSLRSLRHDVVCAYHLAPAPGLVLDEGSRFGRRSAVRLDIERAEALLHVGHLEHLDGGLGDLILQLRLEPGRSDHRVPDARDKIGEPDLGAG